MKILLLTILFYGALGAPRASYDPSRDVARITGGQEATEGQFPYMIYIETSQGYPLCGGSLLDENTVLSASSCMIIPYNERMAAGEHDLTVETGREQRREISNITYHEDFNYGNYISNIAILRPESPFYFNQYVSNVTLPTLPYEDYIQGYPCTVVGWGKTSSGGSTSDILLYTDNKVLSDSECQTQYEPIGETIFESNLCAGEIGGGGAACGNDNGGPLVEGTFEASESGAEAKQIGIFSWARDCGSASFAGVYTQVSYYLDWIAENR